ncbi:uncharacterized protein LOC144167499 [Haemaphysalis longicornis]
MGRIAIAACILGFVALTASAYGLPDLLRNNDEEVGVNDKLSDEEALQLVKILCEAADDLDLDDERRSKTDEYFIGGLWKNAKKVAQKIGGKAKKVVKKYAKKTKHVIKVTAKKLSAVLGREAQRRLTKKAFKVLSKIMGDAKSSSVPEDSEANPELLKRLCTKYRTAYINSVWP